jgi:DNA-binding NarL/FixJ family response regulator
LFDNQRLVRARLRTLIEDTANLEVVGEAANGVEAVRMHAELSPDLILMDLKCRDWTVSRRPSRTADLDPPHRRRRHPLLPDFSPTLLRRLVDRALETRPKAEPPAADLTPRKREVLTLIGEGSSNQEVADRLHLGVTTVKAHVANLMGKTGCDNQVRLAVYAYKVTET